MNNNSNSPVDFLPQLLQAGSRLLVVLVVSHDNTLANSCKYCVMTASQFPLVIHESESGNVVWSASLRASVSLLFCNFKNVVPFSKTVRLRVRKIIFDSRPLLDTSPLNHWAGTLFKNGQWKGKLWMESESSRLYSLNLEASSRAVYRFSEERLVEHKRD